MRSAALADATCTVTGALAHGQLDRGHIHDKYKHWSTQHEPKIE